MRIRRPKPEPVTIERIDRALGHLAQIIETHGTGAGGGLLLIFERLLKDRADLLEQDGLMSEVARYALLSKQG
jgi:hypothetical protein